MIFALIAFGIFVAGLGFIYVIAEIVKKELFDRDREQLKATARKLSDSRAHELNRAATWEG